MSIEFHCQKCNKLLRVPDGSGGKKAQCPSCQTILQIPATTAPPKLQPPEPNPFEPLPSSSGPAPSSPPPAARPSNTGEASPFSPPSQAPPPISDNPFASPMAAASPLASHGAASQNYTLASRGIRLAGAMLDGIIGVAAVLPGIVPVFMGIAMKEKQQGLGVALLVGGGICVLVLGLGVAIYQWYLISTTGQSIAKKMLGMKIIRVEDHSLPGFVHGVALRIFVPALIGAIPTVGGLFGLADALFIFGKEHRCIHDHIAGTIVIQV